MAECLSKILNSKQKIKIIGVRHGEKVAETLATKNELLFSENSKNFFKIKIDSRGLNYDNYFKKGNSKKLQADYTSENTTRLTNTELKKVLLNIPEIKKLLKK